VQKKFVRSALGRTSPSKGINRQKEIAYKYVTMDAITRKNVSCKKSHRTPQTSLVPCFMGPTIAAAQSNFLPCLVYRTFCIYNVACAWCFEFWHRQLTLYSVYFYLFVQYTLCDKICWDRIRSQGPEISSQTVWSDLMIWDRVRDLISAVWSDYRTLKSGSGSLQIRTLYSVVCTILMGIFVIRRKMICKPDMYSMHH
jgi:hypothetical protein